MAIVETKLDRIIEVMTTKQDLKNLENKFDNRFMGLKSKDILLNSTNEIVKKI